MANDQGFTLTTLPFFQVINGMFQRLCSARRALLMALAAALPRSSAAVGAGGTFLVGDAVAFTFMAKGDFLTGEGWPVQRTGSNSVSTGWCLTKMGGEVEHDPNACSGDSY